MRMCHVSEKKVPIVVAVYGLLPQFPIFSRGV